jgi:hypothetical protein
MVSRRRIRPPRAVRSKGFGGLVNPAFSVSEQRLYLKAAAREFRSPAGR